MSCRSKTGRGFDDVARVIVTAPNFSGISMSEESDLV